MTTTTPTHAGAYQLAKWVAHQLPKHPGASTRTLYQSYLPEFAAFGTDGSTGSAMIGQHLRALLDAGLVAQEKGAKSGLPAKWTWIGPTPEHAPACKESLQAEPAAVPHDTTSPANGGAFTTAPAPPLTESEATAIAACFDLMSTRLGPAVPNASDDPWEALAHQFAQACRETAATMAPAAGGIDGLEHKLDTLHRLIPLMYDDIAITLRCICSDLERIGGGTP